MFIGFTSDNASGAHPRVLEAVARCNQGYCRPYGDDEYSEEAVRQFRALLGEDIEVFLALSGTGANVIGLRPLLRPWQGVICSDAAHIHSDESGAPEWGLGSKLLTLPSQDAKISAGQLERYMPDLRDSHHSTPRVVSVTQSTEWGTVYTPEEIRAIADKAHANGLLLHMDGSRIANAVASLEAGGVDLRAVTRDAGVDVMSFGGAKNGLLLGEAVIFFRPELAEDFRTLRKQSLQLASKLRFVAVQFIESLRDGLWLENARHANGMAKKFAAMLGEISYMRVRDPQANAIFVQMAPEYIAALQKEFVFSVFDAQRHIARLMCSFATTDAELDMFVRAARALQ